MHAHLYSTGWFLSLIYFMLLLLLLLHHFSRVWLCATPYTAAHQAPLSLGFSRREHWSGLPFPSPMHESEKWKWSHSVVSSCLQTHALQPTRLLHPRDFPSKSTGVGCHCLLHLFQLQLALIFLTRPKLYLQLANVNFTQLDKLNHISMWMGHFSP